MTPVNPIARLVPGGRATVPQLLSARAAASPDGRFVIDGDRVWTYGEALDEVRRVAGWAQAAAHDGARVASFLPNRIEAMWAWLGTLHAGRTHVALHRAHRGAVLADMIERSRAHILVTDADGMRDLPDLRATHVHTVVVAGPPPAPGTLPAGVRVVAWDEVRAGAAYNGHSDPAAVAGLMYTSGTTGRSKAVQLRHNQLCRGAGWVTWSVGLDERDVLHMWLPLFHIAGQLDATIAAIVGGSAVALYPTFSRSRFWSQIEESEATVFIGFSNVLELVYASDAPPGGGTLRAGIAGGVPPALHRPFEERFGVRLHDVYGMTEAEPMILPAPGETVPPGSCGRPSPDFEVALLGEDGTRVPRGAVGEIAVRPRVPDVMTPGYEGDEAAWVEATRNLWFHTGDLGRQDEEGFLFFVDRRKHAIRRRGENISSWELERIVAGHPAVDECCAVAVPSPLGEDDVKVVVVPAADADLRPAELRAWCTDRMASFMVPRYIEVVGELPRNAVGKVSKQELRGTEDGIWDAEAQEHVRTA